MNLHRRTFLRARRRRAGAAAARCAELPLRAAGDPARAARRMVCINTPLGLHPAVLLPGEGRAGLRAVALPGSPQGLPRRLHGHLRAVASRRRPEPRFQLQLPDGGPASGAAGRLPNSISLDQFAAEHLYGADALRQPAAVVRGLRPLLDPQRRAGADGVLAVERVRQAVPRRPARRGRRPRPAACRTARASSTPSAIRPRRLEPALGAGDREKLDEYFTSVRELEAAAGPGRGVVEEAQAEGRCQAAAERPEPRRPDRQDAALVRPDPPGLADRFHAAGHAATARHQQRAADPGREPGPSRPVAPRQGPGQDRPAQDARDREDEDPARLLHAAEATRRKKATRCSTGRWSSSAATWPTPASTRVKNMPVLLAGGGFKHGQHLAFDAKTTRRCATSTSACCSAWASRPTSSAAARER